MEEAFPPPRRTGSLRPSFWLSREDAVEAQLKALRSNNFPTQDAGIEVLYTFAALDPFRRSAYFSGISLDLGQVGVLRGEGGGLMLYACSQWSACKGQAAAALGQWLA